MFGYPVRVVLRLVLKILTYLIYGVTLLTAYGGYMNPTLFTLPSMGVIFFPYLALLSLITAIIWLIRRQFITGCIGIGILMACGPTFTDAVPFKFQKTASNPNKTFKMATFNCLHLKDIKKSKSGVKKGYNRSLHFLIHCGADFVCLQELYDFKRNNVSEKYKKQVDSLFKIYPYISTDANKEIEFISKYPFKTLPIKLPGDIKYGSVGAYELEIDNNPITVINVHLSSYMLSELERNIITEAHNKKGVKRSIRKLEGSVYRKMKKAFISRARVSAAIAEYAEKQKGNVIVCGDFNDVPGSWSYRNFTKRGFQDAYAQTGFGHLITYNQHLMLFHIDQILFKGDLMPLYVKKERMDASDHYPLVAEFEFI